MGGSLAVKKVHVLRMKKWAGELSIESRFPSRLSGHERACSGGRLPSSPRIRWGLAQAGEASAGLLSPEGHCLDALTQVWSMTFHDQLSRWATTPYSWQKYRSYSITRANTMESFLQIINKHCILFINLVKILQGLAQLPDESSACLLWKMLQAEELSEHLTPSRVRLPQPESTAQFF